MLSDLLEKLGRRDELADLVRRELDAAKDREDRPAHRPALAAPRLPAGAAVGRAGGARRLPRRARLGAEEPGRAPADRPPLGHPRRLAGPRGRPRRGSSTWRRAQRPSTSPSGSPRSAPADGDDDAATAAQLEARLAAPGPGDARLRDELTRRYIPPPAPGKKLAARSTWPTPTPPPPPPEQAARSCAAWPICSAPAPATPAGAAEILVRAPGGADSEACRDVLVALLEALAAKTGQHARAADAVEPRPRRRSS